MTNTTINRIEEMKAKIASLENELSTIKEAAITNSTMADLARQIETAIHDAETQLTVLEVNAGYDFCGNPPAVDETSAAGQHTTQNTKGENEAMTTANTTTTNNTIKGEETMTANNTTITNKGENKSMKTTNTTTKQNTTKGANNMTNFKLTINPTTKSVEVKPSQVLELVIKKQLKTVEAIESTLTKLGRKVTKAMLDETLAELQVPTKGKELKAVKINKVANAIAKFFNKKGNVTRKSAYFTKEGKIAADIKKNRKIVVLTKENLDVLRKYSEVISKAWAEKGTLTPVLASFIGTEATSLVVDGLRKKFVIVTESGERSVQFGGNLGRQLINFLTAIMPSQYPAFQETKEYKMISKMNLKGNLTAKLVKQNKVTADSVYTAAASTTEVHIYNGEQYVGNLFEICIEGGKETESYVEMLLNSDYTMVIFKDTDLKNIHSPNALIKRQSGSLNKFRFGRGLGKKVRRMVVNKTVTTVGKQETIQEEIRAMFLPEMITLDGSAGFGVSEELSNRILKAIFERLVVVESKDGSFDPKAKLSSLPIAKEYSSYVKSMSQARSNGAIGFDSIENAINYFVFTGSNADSFGEKGKNPGEMIMNVAKAYKRFEVGGSNGKASMKGFFKLFQKGEDIKVEKEEKTRKGTEATEKYTEYTITNKKTGKKIVLAVIKDRYSIISENERFLVNILGEDNALQGIKEFSFWADKNSRKILKRNLTDGQGYINSRLVDLLREAGVINSFDAFQLRASIAIKGALLQFDEICEAYGADIVLTEGMVKANEILHDLQDNGLQIYVVGQRKDGFDGSDIAAQALQQMGLNFEEITKGIVKNVKFIKDAVMGNVPADLLAMVDATNEEDENEHAAIDFVRLAQAAGQIADEKYIMDQLQSLAVAKLNKMLDCKLYTTQARARYMFTDPVAIYKAVLAGRVEVTKKDRVLESYQVVCPTIDNGKFTMQTGKAISVRYPVTVSHEIPVVEAVAHPEYKKYIERGIWQGCTFFDAFSWVVAQQAGADHDGDFSIIIFDSLFVNARIRFGQKKFGKLAVLPFIDAYVRVDKNGMPIVSKNEDGEMTTEAAFGTGCPTYNAKDKADVVREIHGFKVVNNVIHFHEGDLKCEEKLNKYYLAQATLAREITLSTIEKSLIGQIANFAMNVTDLLSRDVLTAEERLQVEEDLLILTTAGRWEIDRPKHGGAYLEMPLIDTLFKKFDSMYFTGKKANWSDNFKTQKFIEEKGAFRHMFTKVEDAGTIEGFKFTKPAWMSDLKEQKGVEFKKDSLFDGFRLTAEKAIKHVCDEFKKRSITTANNNIRGLVREHMEVNEETMQVVMERTAELYDAFRAKEKARTTDMDSFKKVAMKFLVKKGVFGNKDVTKLPEAKKNAKVREFFPLNMNEYKVARELNVAQLRRAAYALAAELKLDVRVIVGALYLIINGTKTPDRSSWENDGRKVSFVVNNGNLAVPFEVFKEEMTALLLGPVSEESFVPMDMSFTMVENGLMEFDSSILAGVEAKALVIGEMKHGKKLNVNKEVRVAVRHELRKDKIQRVMYVLRRDAKIKSLDEVTANDAVFVGYAPEKLTAGLWATTVTTVAYAAEETAKTAVITFA